MTIICLKTSIKKESILAKKVVRRIWKTKRKKEGREELVASPSD
jgi:hypothetical protein